MNERNDDLPGQCSPPAPAPPAQDAGMSRRDFLKYTAVGSASLALLPLLPPLTGQAHADAPGGALGQWQSFGLSGVIGIHAAVMSNGRLLFFAHGVDQGFGQTTPDSNLSATFDAGNQAAQTLAVGSSGTQGTPFCAGQVFLPDGRLFVAGGDDLVYLRTFRPTSTSPWGSWSPTYIAEFQGTAPNQYDTNASPNGRWYPTCAVLPDGRVFIVSGTVSPSGGPGTGNPPGGAYNGSRTKAGQPDAANNLNSTYEIFPPSPGGFSRDLDSLFQNVWPYYLYPFVQVLPNGRLFVHISNQTQMVNLASWALEAHLTASVTDDVGQPISRTYPVSGACVLLPLTYRDGYHARVLLIGGAGHIGANSRDTATSTCEILDFADYDTQQFGWRAAPSLNSPRVMPDAVLLPDGTILAVNGATNGEAQGSNAANLYDPYNNPQNVAVPVGGEPNPVTPQPSAPFLAATRPNYSAELFDPAANGGAGAWSPVAPMSVPRLYHSTAVLLPDGRVLTAGSDGWYPTPFNPPFYNDPTHNTDIHGNEFRVEVFSPPYLFENGAAAQRPSISSAPQGPLDYGAPFLVTVTTPGGAAVQKVALMRPGAVTHSNNMDQRYVELQFTQSGGTLTVIAPRDGYVAPPGYYMLFVLTTSPLTNALVPSEAAFVQIAAAADFFPLYRLDDVDYHLLTTSQEEYVDLLEAGWVSGGGTPGGVMGYVAATPIPGWTALYRYYNSETGDHFYTTSQTIGPGYSSEGPVGYVYPLGVGDAPERRQLFHIYNSDSHQHLFTTSAAEVSGLPMPPWQTEAVGAQDAYVLSKAPIALHSFQTPRPGGYQYLLTSDQATYAKFTSLQWASRPNAGYVYTDPSDVPGGDLVGLYHFYASSTGDNYYTISPSGVGSDYQQEEVVGYVFPTAASGRRPLYRAYNPSTNQHLFTVNQQDIQDAPWTQQTIEAYVI